MRVIYFVDSLDNTKDLLCAYDNLKYRNDKDKLAEQIFHQLEDAGFLTMYRGGKEDLVKLAKDLAYNKTANFHEYEFGTEYVPLISTNQ